MTGVPFEFLTVARLIDAWCCCPVVLRLIARYRLYTALRAIVYIVVERWDLRYLYCSVERRRWLCFMDERVVVDSLFYSSYLIPCGYVVAFPCLDSRDITQLDLMIYSYYSTFPVDLNARFPDSCTRA